MPNSDDEEEKEKRKRKRIENLENARKVKKIKASTEPRTKQKLKTASARVLKESQVLCGEETQAVLNEYLPLWEIWVYGWRKFSD